MHLERMTWPALARLSPDTPVVVPIAACEQHGHHLPLATDAMLLGEVVRRAEAAVGDRVLFAPVQWLGDSDHHLDFCGTLSAAPRTYLEVLENVVENLLRHGFRRIVLLNGHGGNIVPGQHALNAVRQRHRARREIVLLMATYWLLGGEPWQHDDSFEQRRMGHACEWETSMMLRIAPEHVGDLAAVESIPFGNGFEPAYRAWITIERTSPGHIGNPRVATADKGETLFRVFSQDVIAWLEKVVAWDGTRWTN